MTFDFETEVVSIDAGTSSLQAETLQKGARDAEESATGIVYQRIIDTSGKVTLDAQSETGLTVTLLRNWKILSLKTSGLLSVGGGNVVNENTGVLIFDSNPQVDTQNNTSVAGVRVTPATGTVDANIVKVNGNSVDSDGILDVNVKEVNDVVLQGSGVPGDSMRPV